MVVVELKPRMILPLVGVVLLSGVLVGCGAPETTTASASSPSTTEPGLTPSRQYPSHLTDIIQDERFQNWRKKVVAAGLSPVVGVLGSATAIVRNDEDADPLATRSDPLFDTVSEKTSGIGSISAGDPVNFRRTLEVWNTHTRRVRDKLALLSDNLLAALKYKDKDYVRTPITRVTPDIPIQYFLWEHPQIMRPTTMQRLEQGLPLAS